MNYLRAYISPQVKDFHYVAERTEKGHFRNQKYIWKIAPRDVHKPERKITISRVPPNIRREAYYQLGYEVPR